MNIPGGQRLCRRFFVCLCVLLSACVPRITRPIIPPASHIYYTDYQVDLTTLPETSLHVTLQLPSEAPPCDSFCFPIQIPGTYNIKYYGKYVTNFKAWNTDGNMFPFDKIDSSIFIFVLPQQVKKISYDVHQSFGNNDDSTSLFEGVRIKPDHLLINPYATFGFFPRFKDKPVRVKLILPPNWRIGTSLPLDSSGYFYAHSYDELQDSPFLAGRLSQDIFENNGKHYFVYVQSDTPSISARRLRSTLKGAVQDMEVFYNGFPSGDYSFLLSFLTDSTVSSGAHEHTHSSVYGHSLKNYFETKDDLKWVVRHELFHTFTPLELCGDDISQSDYMKVYPVTHLWFYEGLAQWAAFKMQLINRNLSPEKYLNVFRNCLYISDTKTDSLAYLSLSKVVHTKRSLISDVYRRGFIFGTLLDMYIIEKTAGQITLRELLLKMHQDYHKGKSFKADSLFKIISSLSHPDVEDFLTQHLNDGIPVDIKTICNNIGVVYSERETHPLLKSELGCMFRTSDDKRYLLISGVYKEAHGSGFLAGDTLQIFDDRVISPVNFHGVVKNFVLAEPGKLFNAVVKGRDGRERTIHAQTIPFSIRHTMRINYVCSTDTRKLFQIWQSR